MTDRLLSQRMLKLRVRVRCTLALLARPVDAMGGRTDDELGTCFPAIAVSRTMAIIHGVRSSLRYDKGLPNRRAPDGLGGSMDGTLLDVGTGSSE
jgi:hypothetical protein